MAIFLKPVVRKAEAESLVARVSWFHSFEIVPGVMTPGHVVSTPGALIDSLELGDLNGRRVLEVGAWDGPVSYELKLRGADVTAVDIQDPSKTGFNVMRAIGGVSVPYVRESVYNLPNHFSAVFDIVLFFGVYYHLKYPNLAFESIAKVMKPGGRLFTEGAGLGTYVEDVDGQPVAPPEEAWALLEELDRMGVPLTLAYPGTFIGGHNWYLPNSSTLRGWLTAAGFEIENEWSQAGGRQGEIRRAATGRKVREPSIEHNLTGHAGGVSFI